MKLATIPGAVELLRAEKLEITESKLRRDVEAGRVPSMKVGTRTLVDVDAARTLAYRADGIGIEELSRETGLKDCAIRRGIREGWIPFDKKGKAYQFELGEVLAAIKEHMKKQ